MTAITFVVMTGTGIILFVTPPGRVANWTGWTIFGLTKAQWGALHIWFSAAFLAAAVWHTILNWAPLVGYFKSRLTRRLAFRWEWTVAVVLSAVVLGGTLAEVPPFSSLVAWNESIKESWDETNERAPIPHAELFTLAELAAETGVSIEVMVANLSAKDIDVPSPDIVVGALAEDCGLTPQELYKIIVAETGHGEGGGPRGGGPGRKTLAQFCADEQIDIEAACDILRAAGVEANGTMIVRDIVDAAGIKPFDLVELLRNKES
jgi:hypothetical protein